MKSIRPLLLTLGLIAGVAACSPTDPRKPHQPPMPSVAVPPAQVPVLGATATGGAVAQTGGQGAAASAPTVAPDAAPEARAEPDGEDVTAKVRAMQSDRYSAPPTTFRQGHVTPRKLGSEALTRTAKGFEVALPSGAPIVTPAVYDGAVFVSGGFRSKELYAVDAETGALRWGLSLDDDGPSAPACADGICVFNTESCTVFAVAAADGKHLWSWWLGDPLTSAPAIANGRVFTSYPVAGGHGGGLNANPGAAGLDGLQQLQIPNAPPGNAANPTPAPAPRAADGQAKPRPPGATHALAALDLKTGKILWQVWLDSDVMSAPVAVEGDVLVTTFAGTFVRLDQATGAVEAARQVRATSAPVVAGNGNVYYTRRADGPQAKAAAEAIAMAGRDGQTLALQARKAAPYLDKGVQAASQLAQDGKDNDSANGFAAGAPAAANPQAAYHNVGQASVYTMQAFQGSRILALAAGNVSAMGDEVVCTDPKSGERLWALPLTGDVAKAGGFLAAPPAAAGDSIFVGTLGGEILQLDPKSGDVQHRWDLGHPIRAQPVIDGGWIYAGTTDGRLVALNTGDPSLTGWSQWGADAARTGAL